jgi:formyl-CoA transferase
LSELGEGTTEAAGPLAGVRVIECGSLIAGPFCGQLLGDFGAEVVKVEDPAGGDPMRSWGPRKVDGLSLHWPIIARNKG